MQVLDRSLIIVSRNTIQCHCRKGTSSQFNHTSPASGQTHWKDGAH